MKKNILLGFLFSLLLAACGEDSTTEKITEVAGSYMDVVSDVSLLPSCSDKNDGELVWVKNEATPRMCSDGKWYAVADGSVAATCYTEPLPDGSGAKILCGGDSIGVVLNGADGDEGDSGKAGKRGVSGKNGADGKDGATGADGQQGAQGIQGEKGDSGAAGVGCSMESIDDYFVRVICGEDSSILRIGEPPDTAGQGEVVLDSEKIAISLDEVSGVTQKGPFLMGSKVLVREMEDGRTLTQTGNSFNGKILNDKGEFRINARMLVSQYVMLEATGYYRNEVTGENSNSELTLFAISDVNDRSVVNVNLLTHLEYERVVYLVTQKKMKVKTAKKQAQKEVFGLLGIDATNFSNSEDLNIAGSNDEDGALLAFSLMFQGDRSVADLTALLQAVANDMEKDGTWDDATTRMKIAEWAADADGAGKYATFRNNVLGWGLSVSVPNFEKYLRAFWYGEYGLGDCTHDSVGVIKAAAAGKQKKSDIRYICKAAEDSDVDYRWQIAGGLERDIYGWISGEDGEIRTGIVTGIKYLYDASIEQWRVATSIEEILGACIESVAADIKKNTGLVNGSQYKCENREWVRSGAYIVETDTWIEGSDGDLKLDDETGSYYVYDEAERAWRIASDNDVKLKLMGCTTNRLGQWGKSNFDERYYSCDSNHAWVFADKALYNTAGYDCDKEGLMITGTVDTKTYFVCDAGSWREATVTEEVAGAACTALLEGSFNMDSSRVCDNKEFRVVNVYDFDVGVKDYFSPEVTYGTLFDERDGRSYKTVSINGYTVMAENLNYADESTHSYLIDNNWCYNNDTANCLKGGRYYSWTAAMDIDSKWQKSEIPSDAWGTPHQGICPNGWHIPTYWEMDELLNLTLGYYGNEIKSDTTGLSVLATGGYNTSGYYSDGVIYYDIFYFVDISRAAYFWTATETDGSVNGNSKARCLKLDMGKTVIEGCTENKNNGYSVRCFKDAVVAP